MVGSRSCATPSPVPPGSSGALSPPSSARPATTCVALVRDRSARPADGARRRVRRGRPRRRRGARPAVRRCGRSLPRRRLVQARPARPLPREQVNVEGTRNALAAAQRAGVPRVVYTSTLAVNSDTEEQVVDETYRFTGEHVSDYDRTKAEAHEIALDFVDQGLDVVIVQPGLVYGPGDTAQTGELIAQVVPGRSGRSVPRAAACAGRTSTTSPTVTCGRWSAAARASPTSSPGPRATLAEGLQQGRGPGRHQGPDRAAHADGRSHRRPDGEPGQGRPRAAGLRGRDDARRAGDLLRHRRQGREELDWHARPLEQGLRETVRLLPHALSRGRGSAVQPRDQGRRREAGDLGLVRARSSPTFSTSRPRPSCRAGRTPGCP